MKKFFVLLTVFAVVLLAAGTAMATIVGSKHDLRSNNATVATIKANATFEDLCVICHTPHNAVAASAPLWNRTTAMESSYNTYTTARGNGWTPGAPSKACLGCHDGSLGADSLVNPSFGGYPIFSAAAELAMSNSPAAIGNGAASLSNDHPVGLTVPATGFDTTANIELAGLNLYGASNNTVECGTCHDAHENGTAAAGTYPFLAISNLNSAMCLECHIK